MKNYYAFCFMTLLIIIMRVDNILAVKNSITAKESMQMGTELDDLIEYLAKETEKASYQNQNSKRSNSVESDTNFIETSSHTEERGLGCESFSKCSGKGTCQNGACLCDEGYDYFDCSVNVLSNKIIFLIFRKMYK